MSLKNYINEFSAGKIILKYNLIHPEVSENKRKLVVVLYILFNLIILFQILKIYDRFPYYNAGFAVLIWVLFGLVTGKITGFFILGLKICGKVFFLEDHILIQRNGQSEKIFYSDVKTIFYQPNVRKSIFYSGHYKDPKSVKVKFVLQNQMFIIIEAENDLFMTKEDYNQFRTGEPNLIGILEEIRPKYGVERVKNILKTG